MSKIQEAKKLLKQYFGYDEFRQGQEQLIEAALNGQDVLGIMPTGAGKSLCFQIPALMMDGITLVISPLISDTGAVSYRIKICDAGKIQDHLCGTRTLGNRRFYQFCAK